ncbi:ABC transporter substrate-binding protein [Arenimonas sp.]|uniref:ABC transporter substrate-binding protein n=1 Tax=Arenimonas sp. TaxID=1872635 RepID=UPI0035B17EFB
MALRDLTARFEPVAWGLPLVLAVVGLMAMVAWLAPAPPPPPLRVAVGPWIGYEPLVLASETNDLPASVRLVESVSNTESTQLLREGMVDLAGFTLDEAIRLASDGTDLRIVAVLSDSHGADAVVVRPGVESLADLRDQRVLVEDTAVGHLILQRALAGAGLSLADVRKVQVQAPYLPARWREGDAAAAVVYEPFLSEMMADGAVPLFTTASNPGLVLDVLVARADVLDARRGDVVALLQAWDRGVAAFRQPDTLPLGLLTADGRVDSDTYRRALAGIAFFDLDENRRFLGDRPAPVQASIDALVAILREGALGADLRVAPDLVDARFVEAAARVRPPGAAP